MKGIIASIILITIPFFLVSFSQSDYMQCVCDKKKVEKKIVKDNYNQDEQFKKLTSEDFKALSAVDNKALWYVDIESPKETKFTKLWNDYEPNNYRSSHIDFIKHYQGRKDIAVAFQFGPNADLWGFHTFVIKKVNCCYLATRSYFRHSRFISKRFAVINEEQLDTLFLILSKQRNEAINSIEAKSYSGYFVDNINRNFFYVDFENDQIWETIQQDTSGAKYPVPDIMKMKLRPEIEELFDFVDNKIKWKKTYDL